MIEKPVTEKEFNNYLEQFENVMAVEDESLKINNAPFNVHFNYFSDNVLIGKMSIYSGTPAFDLYTIIEVR